MSQYWRMGHRAAPSTRENYGPPSSLEEPFSRLERESRFKCPAARRNPQLCCVRTSVECSATPGPRYAARDVLAARAAARRRGEDTLSLSLQFVRRRLALCKWRPPAACKRRAFEFLLKILAGGPVTEMPDFRISPPSVRPHGIPRPRRPPKALTIPIYGQVRTKIGSGLGRTDDATTDWGLGPGQERRCDDGSVRATRARTRTRAAAAGRRGSG